jgi:oligosaccharide repeat unit polymerase
VLVYGNPFLEYYRDAINTALIYAIVGFIALSIGYNSKLPNTISKYLPSINFYPNWGKLFFLIYIGVIIGVSFNIYNFTYGQYMRWLPRAYYDYTPSYRNLLGYISTYGLLYSYVLALVCYFGPKKSKLLSVFLWLILLPSIFIFFLLSGERKFIIYTILFTFFIYSYAKGNISFKKIILAGIILFLFIAVVLLPVIGIYRDTSLQSNNISDIVYVIVEEYPPSFYRIIEQFMNRFPGIDSLAVTIKSIPEVQNFQYGKTLTKMVILFIPEFILKNKGDYIRLGEMFNRNYFGNAYFSDWVLTPVGEFYLNFHVIGIIVGMFSLGIILKVFYVYFRRNDNIGVLVIYLFFWISATNIENDIGIVWGAFLRHVIILLLIFKCVNKRKLLTLKN